MSTLEPIPLPDVIREAQADRLAQATKQAQGRPSALKSLLLLLVSHN